MSDSASVEPAAPGMDPSRAWQIRAATAADVAPLASAVAQLLGELGGRQPTAAELEREVGALIEDPAAGLLLLAEAGGEVVGVLGASWQRAIHVPGRYGTIQDLWVAPSWRSRSVGAGLVDAFVAIAREQGISRLEVGLPRESFDGIRSTEAFYLANGFEHLGARMRRLLP